MHMARHVVHKHYMKGHSTACMQSSSGCAVPQAAAFEQQQQRSSAHPWSLR
jgi:hypothetical protein